MVFDGTRFLIGAGLLGALAIVVLVVILFAARHSRGQPPIERPTDDDPSTPSGHEFPPPEGPTR